MANANPSRIGQINGQGDVDALFLPSTARWVYPTIVQPPPSDPIPGDRTFGGNVLFSGHSLVNTDMPNIFNDFQDEGEVTHYSVINGSPMVYRWDNGAEAQGVDARVQLATGDVDQFVIVEAGPIENYFPAPGTAAEYGPLWFDAALDSNPNCQFVLYSTWPSFNDYPVMTDWLNKLVADFNAYWRPLADHINNTRAAGRPEALLAPGGSALWTLQQRIENGEVTSLTSIQDLFADDIHLTTTGNYFIACLMYAVTYGETPVGKTNAPIGEFSPYPVIDPQLALDLQETAWIAATNDGYTGVHLGINTVPTAPAAPTLAPASEAISVTPAMPAGQGGNSVYKHEIRYSLDGSTWTTVTQYGPTAKRIEGLTGGATYTIQTRAVNAVGPSPWSTSATATAGLPANANPVRFDGTVDYLVKSLTPSPGYTFAMRLRIDQEPLHFGFLSHWIQFTQAGGLVFQAGTTTYASIVPQQEIAAGVATVGAEIALMVAVHSGGALSDGKSASFYVNGVEVYSTTEAPGGNLDLQWFSVGGQDFGGQMQRFITDGVWVATEALDPAVHWSSLFDPTNNFVPPADGVVGGVTPALFQTGDAAAWASGTDNIGNTYTMNGSVTDA